MDKYQDSEFFYEQIDRLKGLHGDRPYSPERNSALFKEMEFLTRDELEGLVTEILLEHINAPPMTKIRELLKAYKDRHSQENSRRYRAWLSSLPICQTCGNDGCVFATQKWADPFHYRVLFACPCVVGQRTKNEFMTTWNDVKHAVNYSREIRSFTKQEKKPRDVRQLASFVAKSMPQEGA